MRIAFLGTPEFCLPLLEAVREVADLAFVVAQPDKAVGRSSALQMPPTKRWALDRGIPVHQPVKVRDGKLAAMLRDQRVDVAVVAAYGRILPAEVLAAPRLGCLNVHASLLPELRGAAPAQWAIARGNSLTGVTLMQMDEGLDTGDIRLQRACPIGPEETAHTLLPKLAELGAVLLRQGLPMLEAGTLPRTPQDSARATLAPILRREDAKVEFTRAALECDQRLRGFTPWPGAYALRDGQMLKIHAARALTQLAAGDPQPGEIVAAGHGGIDVACAHRSIWRLLEVQPEGKRRMDAAAYLAGRPFAAGERLS